MGQSVARKRQPLTFRQALSRWASSPSLSLSGWAIKMTATGRKGSNYGLHEHYPSQMYLKSPAIEAESLKNRQLSTSFCVLEPRKSEYDAVRIRDSDRLCFMRNASGTNSCGVTFNSSELPTFENDHTRCWRLPTKPARPKRARAPGVGMTFVSAKAYMVPSIDPSLEPSHELERDEARSWQTR